MDNKVLQQEFISILTSDNGLHLISSPTGSGKTKNIIEALSTYVKQNPNDTRRFLFLGPQKKNLPIDDFENDKNAVIVYSQADCMKKAIKNKSFMFESLPFYAKVKKEIDFLKAINDIQNYSDTKNSSIARRDFYKELHSYIKNEIKRIKKMCIKVDGDGEEYFDRDKAEELYIKYIEKKENNWIRILAPEYYLPIKKMGIMTYDKFLLPIHFGLHHNINFMWPNKTSDIIKQDCGYKLSIICDELDKFKIIVWNHIIDKSLSNPSDLLYLLSKIDNRSVKDSLNKELKALFKKNEKRFESLYNSLDCLKEKYHFDLDYQIQAEDFNDLLGIFESTVYPVVNNFTDTLNLKYDMDNNCISLLTPGDDIEDSQNLNLDVFIYEAIRCILNFQGIIRDISKDYHKKNKQDLDEEDTIYTVLDKFKFTKEEKSFLASSYVTPSNTYKHRTLHPLGRGFDYVKLVNGKDHDDCIRLFLYSVSKNPDILLGELASKFNVIGLTANGSLEMLNNFSSDYLYEILGDKFITRHKAIDEFFAEYYDRMYIEYKNNNINVNSMFAADRLSQGEMSENNIVEWIKNNIRFSSYETYKTLKMIIDNYWMNVSKNSDCFDLLRFLELASVISLFVKNPNQQRGIFFTQFKFDDKKTDYFKQQRNIMIFIDSLCKECELSQEEYTCIFYNNLNDFQVQLDNSYKKGYKKVLIFSSHESLSMGVNLQGPSSNNKDRIIHIFNDDKSSRRDKRFKEKDISFIYIGSFHYWMVGSDLNPKDQNGLDFDWDKGVLKTIGKIVEILSRAGTSFTTGDFNHTIRAILSHEYKIISKIRIDSYTTPLVTNCLLAYILQECGRITRTYRKNPDIIIVLSNEFKRNIFNKKMVFSLGENIIMTPEFRSIYQLLHSEEMLSENYKNKLQECRNRTQASYHYMRERINVFFSNEKRANKEKAIELYIKLRDMILRYPTVNSMDFLDKENEEMRIFWISFVGKDVDEYSYKKPMLGGYEGKSFGEIEFVEPGSGGITVSENAAQLPILMNHSLYRNAFERAGYPTKWTPARYILNPYAFNIYKGILGEIIGEIIFEKLLGYKLCALPVDNYEFFDFCISGMQDIMIDFKDWSKYFYGPSRKDYLPEIYGKMKHANLKNLLLVRLFGEDVDAKPEVLSDEAGRTIYVIPGLLDKRGDIISQMRDDVIKILLEIKNEKRR